jgi:type VI secretion system secreted protein VgrG
VTRRQHFAATEKPHAKLAGRLKAPTMPLDQTNRALKIDSPLGPNKLLLASFTGVEEISRLFGFQLELFSESQLIAADAIVGKPIGFSIDYNVDRTITQRYFHGRVSRWSAGAWDQDKKIRKYRAEVVPWFWFLTRTANCRIFQHMSVPDILKKVFSDRGFTDFEIDVQSANHPAWDYCVQYRETEFNFCSRLMEQEGIFYFFRHEKSKHVMVITDKMSKYLPCNPPAINYKGDTGETRTFDELSGWDHQYEFRPGKWAQIDYDMTKPTADMLTTASMPKTFDRESSYEVFDFPEQYPVEDTIAENKAAYGMTMTRQRQEEDAVPQDLVHAEGLLPAIAAGVRFSIKEHLYPEEKGKNYVVTALNHTAIESSAYATGDTYGEQVYRNTFTCIPAEKPFRPARLTHKPFVQGTQTAIVVGPSGQEIFTDEFGRVKVQFHWDREGKKNENSSCFIRVAQPWAGKRWGAMFLPRIGQEVVVSFLEGDPDRPLIVGSVYNADQRPAYLGNGLDSKHPNDKNISGIKSNSTLGGSGFNEFRFDDTAGKEEIFIHAQHNMDTRVLADSKERIFGNRHEIIGWEKDGSKAGDQRTHVYGNRQIHIDGNHAEHIDGSMQLKVGDKGGNLDIVVTANRTEQVKGNADLKVDGNQNEKVGTMSLTVGTDQQTKVGMKSALEAGQEIHIKSGMKIVIEAGLQLTLKGPGGFVDIGPAGVTIQGTLVNINSGGAAGSGSGSKPAGPATAKEAKPADPAMANDSKSGMKSSYQ